MITPSTKLLHAIFKKKTGEWHSDSITLIFEAMDQRLLGLREANVGVLFDYCRLVQFALRYLRTHPDENSTKQLSKRVIRELLAFNNAANFVSLDPIIEQFGRAFARQCQQDVINQHKKQYPNFHKKPPQA